MSSTTTDSKLNAKAIRRQSSERVITVIKVSLHNVALSLRDPSAQIKKVWISAKKSKSKNSSKISILTKCNVKKWTKRLDASSKRSPTKNRRITYTRTMSTSKDSLSSNKTSSTRKTMVPSSRVTRCKAFPGTSIIRCYFRMMRIADSSPATLTIKTT